MAKLKVLREFSDLVEGVIRSPGETFECTEGRAKEIVSVLPGFAEIEEPRRKPQQKAR
jgi:hypothetical protein